MSKAMLIDTTRCVGCRGCQVACKSWNELEAGTSSFSETGSNPRHLDANNFTRVLFQEVSAPDGSFRWSFVKRQCMHCLEPSCASACPVGALHKTAEGVVAYADEKCIGCRYCMVACPFQVPKYQWSSLAPFVRKCTFCADRQAAGKSPSCVSTCPTGTLRFGERQELLTEAHRRIDAEPGRYHPEVYGERTVGGTGVLYLTAVSFAQMGLEEEGFRTDLGEYPFGHRGKEWMSGVPWVAAAAGGLSLGLYYLNQRRAKVEQQEGKED
jgi:formate dehydrogenase iron-sulfur subunit